MKKIYFLLMILSASIANAQFTQQWLNSWNGVGYREYYNIQTMQDNTGNIYVAAGFNSIDSTSASNSLPVKRPAGFVVAKYLANTLTQSWLRVVESSYCDFKNMVISTGGDAYVSATVGVTGQGNNAQFYRFASSTGTLATNYPRTYNSGGTNNDEAVGIALNSSSQIFFAVNGNVGSATQTITTIKYSNAALPVVLWTANYDNSGTTEKGLELIMNGTDPVVIGEKFSSTKDYVLLGYATADGSNFMETTIAQDQSYTDVQFCHLTLGTGSNLYVGLKGKTGANTFTGTAYKFTFAGFLLSTTTFAGTGAQLDNKLRVIELSNDVIIAQASQDQTSLMVQRFDGSNTAQWTSAYTESNFKFADAKSESTTPVGIYIVGTSIAGSEGNDSRIVKLSVGGTSTYSANFDNSAYSSNENPVSLIVTQSGAAALSGIMTESNGNQKVFTVGYNVSGTQSGGLRVISDQNDNIRNVVTDSFNNVYVSGNTTDASNLNDVFVSKYNSAGTLLWNSRIGVSSKDETTAPKQLAVDANGNVFVVGTVLNSNNDILVACLRGSDGAMYGSTSFNGTGNSSDIPYAIALDASGNVYITGETRVSGANRNIAILKYNKYCVQQSFAASSFEGTAAGTDIGRDIAIDPSGNVYIVGESATSASSTTDIITLKYSSSGSLVWTNAINDANGNDAAGGLTIDALNNIYITGGVINSSTNSDAVTVKYDPTGSQIWMNTYNSGTNAESGSDVSVNANFEVGVGGQSSAGANQDILVVKINPDGTNNYGAIYNGAGNSNDFERSTFINPSGNIFIGGQFVNTGSNTDGILLHYNNAGVLTSNSVINIGATDNVSRVYFDATNKVFISGTTNSTNPNDAFVGKFDMPVTNESPQVSNIANQTTCGTAVGPLSFTVLDENNNTTSVSATSSNTLVIPNSNITLSGSGTSRTISVAPQAGQSGIVTISIQATDAESNSTIKTFTIDVTAVPSTPTISASGPTSFCSGGTVDLTSSSTVGNLWSNGATTQTITVSTAATFTVSVTNNCGSATSTVTSTSVLSPPVAAVISADGATTFCSPGSVNLLGNNGGIWNNGQTTPSINVTTSGTYSVTTSNSCGSVTSNTIAVTVNNCGGGGPQGSFPTSQCGYITNVPNGSMYCNTVIGATGYLVKFYNVSSSIVYAQKTIATTSVTFTGLVPALINGTQYDVTVTPIMPIGPAGVESAKCRMGLIATQTPNSVLPSSLSTPACVSNPASAPVLANSAAIRCTAVPQASTFLFRFENVANPADIILVNQSSARTRTLAPLNLTAGATYGVSVKATVAGVQASNFGPVCYIKMAGGVKESAVINFIDSKEISLNLEVTPNPVLDEMFVLFNATNNENATIAISDIAGKVVYRSNIVTNMKSSIDNLEIKAGVYFVTATLASGERKIVKIIRR